MEGRTEKVDKGDSSQTEEVQGGGKSKFKTLEMLVFSGTNLDSWLFQAERYFEVHQLSDTEKIIVSIIGLVQFVVDWYRWANDCKKITLWEDLKAKLF